MLNISKHHRKPLVLFGAKGDQQRLTIKIRRKDLFHFLKVSCRNFHELAGFQRHHGRNSAKDNEASQIYNYIRKTLEKLYGNVGVKAIYE
jgi:hypothetical protein